MKPQNARYFLADFVNRDVRCLQRGQMPLALPANIEPIAWSYASERFVTEALERLMKGRTSIVIAHHLNTIRNAGVIFVIKDAEVVERGTHDVLLAKGGVYAELHAIQSAGGALAQP